MNFSPPGSGAWRVAALLALAMALASARAQEPTDAGWRDVSLAQYRQHLLDLDALAAACQKQRAAEKAAQSGSKPGGETGHDACDAKSVGPNDLVQQSGGAPARQVRYDWLRSVLNLAGRHSEAVLPSVLAAAPRTTNQPQAADALLADARQRLEDDARQAASPAPANPSYAAERRALNIILAQRAYQGVNEISTSDRLREWLENRIDDLLAGLERLGARAPWIAWLARLLVLGGICTALIWFLLRIEWRSRAQLVLEEAPAPGAPSAREWQLWLKDARAMADKAEWRQAIHFLYWASIARLESMRLWPADRARTPREYLRLLAGADPRNPALTALTRSFERTWYGGRAAVAADFDSALKQAAALGVNKE